MAGTIERARGALRSHEFRMLLALRLLSTAGDGLVQASLVTSIVFNPEQHETATGFAIASLVVVLPFSVVGPFAGVFIDRWSRRRILLITPVLRAAGVWLVLFDPTSAAIPFYAGALWVLSLNRFFLSTANAVVPRLVPTEDLLMANSLATIGGTTTLLAGVFVGGLVADAFGTVPIVVSAAVLWVLASGLAGRIQSSLIPHHAADAKAPLGAELVRVGREFADGAAHLVRTPRAVGPISSMAIDQMGQGLVLVLSLVVFRERFQQGVGSFSWLIGAGAVGVFLGLLTVGKLEERFAKERIIAGAFLAGGAVLLLVSTHITGWSVLVASYATGLTFAWKKIPSDTLIQESVPDGYRGRIFAAYDVFYQCSRLIGIGLAIPMRPALGTAWSVAALGIVFVLWTPVLPRWIGRRPELEIRFYEGAKAEEWPRAVVWGGVEESVEVLRSWREQRAGVVLECFRLALADGTVIDVSRREAAKSWTLDRELEGEDDPSSRQA